MSPNGELPPVEEGHPDTRPYLCIPYWSAAVPGASPWDTGADRPLPGAVVSYLCDSIHAGPYTPGNLLEVEVDVRNSGGGSSTAIATVVVYWADPSVGFAKPNFFAASTVAVPPIRTTPAVMRTPVMRATIPASAPPHICLLARVSHPQDTAGKAADPVGDRHWAQRNLVAVSVAPGAPGVVPFVIANPFDEGGGFVLAIGPTDERHAVEVARAAGRELAQVPATLRLLDENGASVGDRGEAIRTSLELRGQERRAFQLLVDVDSELPEGHAACYEVLMLDSSGERLVGSLGVALTAG